MRAVVFSDNSPGCINRLPDFKEYSDTHEPQDFLKKLLPAAFIVLASETIAEGNGRSEGTRVTEKSAGRRQFGRQHGVSLERVPPPKSALLESPKDEEREGTTK